MNIPVLETERLLLRPLKAEDFPAYASIWSEEAVTRHISGIPMTEEVVWAKFLRSVGQWHVSEFGFWAVEEKASGRLIGEVGFVEALREIAPSLKGIPEIGWAFAGQVHGRGFAYESTMAAIKWGENRFDEKPMRCIIAPKNEPSIRLATKLDFVEVTRTTYKDIPTIMFERRSIRRHRLQAEPPG